LSTQPTLAKNIVAQQQQIGMTKDLLAQM